MLTNVDVSVIFLIYGQFGAIRKLDSRRMVYNTYIFSNSNLLFSKAENRTRKSLTQFLFYYCFQINADINKMKWAFGTKRYIF